MTLDGNTSGLHCLKAPSRPPSSCRDRHRHHHHHQHQHHHHHHSQYHHHFFFPRSFFCNRLLFRLFYWSVSRQTRNTKGKSPGPMQVLTGVEEVDWKGGRSGLRPGFGSSWDDWLASPRRVAAKGVMAACVRVAVQRAVRAAATLCWRMAGACLARAKLLRPLRSTCPQPRLQAPPIGSVGC